MADPVQTAESVSVAEPLHSSQTAPGAEQGSLLIPALRYRDAHAAIAWLERVFGFTRHAVYEGPDGTVAHAELAFGTGMIMLGSASNPSTAADKDARPEEIGGRSTSAFYLIADNTAQLYEQARAAGAEIIMDLRVMDYGGQAFACVDPEGFQWSVGQYTPWRIAH